MKRFARNLLMCLGVLCSSMLSTAQTRDHMCATAGKHSYGSSVVTANFDFTWSSDWGAQDAERNCVCRTVHNASQHPLYYSWPRGTVALNPALPPGATDSVCQLDDSQISLDSDLFYGRAGYQLTTHLWETTTELRAKANENSSSRGKGGGEIVGTGDTTDVPRSFTVGIESHTQLALPKQYLFFIPLPNHVDKIDVNLVFESTVRQLSKDYYELEFQIHNRNFGKSVQFALLSTPPDSQGESAEQTYNHQPSKAQISQPPTFQSPPPVCGFTCHLWPRKYPKRIKGTGPLTMICHSKKPPPVRIMPLIISDPRSNDSERRPDVWVPKFASWLNVSELYVPVFDLSNDCTI